VTGRGARVGWEYVHSIVDDCSRLAYAEIHDDERAATVTAFTRRAFEFFEGRGIAIERLMTDNDFSYTKSISLAELLDRRAASHLLIRPYTPRTNGKVERSTRP
jgi:transposase